MVRRRDSEVRVRASSSGPAESCRQPALRQQAVTPGPLAAVTVRAGACPARGPLVKGSRSQRSQQTQCRAERCHAEGCRWTGKQSMSGPQKDRQADLQRDARAGVLGGRQDLPAQKQAGHQEECRGGEWPPGKTGAQCKQPGLFFWIGER